MTAEEHEAIRRSMAEQRRRVREDLAELTGRTPEEVEESVEEYEMPDLDELESVPADEFYGDE